MKNQIDAPGSRFGLLQIMLAAGLWGTIGVFVQMIYGLSDTNPLSIGFLRLVISLPVLLGACRYTLGSRMVQIAHRDLLLMLLIGAMTAVYQVCYFAAIVHIGVAPATLITLCTAPVWVALFASVWFQERLTAGVIGSGLCAIAGTIALVGTQPNSAPLSSNPLSGIGLALGSALGYAIVTLCSRALAGRYHPLQSLAIGFAAGAAFLLPVTLSAGLVIHYPLGGWLALLYLGVITTALGYWLYFSGIRHTSATIASIVSLLEPLTATVLAGWLFNERLSPFGWLGAVLLLFAIGLLYQGNDRGNGQSQ